ncbi:MAG: GNAT family N-acetyltransferase [Phycisphaerae bacterium]
MAQADISVVTEQQLPVIVELYNQVFRPAENEDYFRRRFQGRYNVLVMLASLDTRPVGFIIGFELKPFVFYNWLIGVHNDFRRKAIAIQLVESQNEWARKHGYEYTRFESLNRHKAMLHLALTAGYDIVGTRWDSVRSDLLIEFEKTLIEELE